MEHGLSVHVRLNATSVSSKPIDLGGPSVCLIEPAQSRLLLPNVPAIRKVGLILECLPQDRKQLIVFTSIAQVANLNLVLQ